MRFGIWIPLYTSERRRHVDRMAVFSVRLRVAIVRNTTRACLCSPGGKGRIYESPALTRRATATVLRAEQEKNWE
jgi:hypothetical protein